MFRYFNFFEIDYYDQNFCFKLCSQDKLLAMCGCIDITTPSIENATYCASDNELDCLNDFNINFTTVDIGGICMCPQQCEIIDYDLKTTFAKFPTYTYLKNLATDQYTNLYFPTNISDNVTEDELIQFANIGFLKVIVNYDTLYYTKYEDQPAKTPSSVIGEIGGQLGNFFQLFCAFLLILCLCLGLCGGISLLNFMEIVGIFISFLYRLVEQRKKRNQIKPTLNLTTIEEFERNKKNFYYIKR